MTTETKHTPTPDWKATQARTLIHIHEGHEPVCAISISANHVYEDGTGLRKAYIQRQKDRAEFIVRACNAHDDLVAALESARDRFAQFYTATTTNAKGRDDNRALKKQAIAEIDAALEKAKAGA